MFSTYWQEKNGILLQNVFISHIRYRILPNWWNLFYKKNQTKPQPKQNKPQTNQKTRTLKTNKKPQTHRHTCPHPKQTNNCAFSIYRGLAEPLKNVNPQTLPRMACGVWQLQGASCGAEWVHQLWICTIIIFTRFWDHPGCLDGLLAYTRPGNKGCATWLVKAYQGFPSEEDTAVLETTACCW